MSELGHNGVAAEELKQFVERIERLEEEKKGISDDIKEVFAELKGRGFDPKIVRKVLAIRKQDAAERQEQEAILELYMDALGMLATTPLGQAAIERETRRAPAQSELKKAVEGLGTPVEPTEEERGKGVVAAFEKGGTRMTIATEMPPIPDFLDRRKAVADA